jgi:hypothetical protein
MNSWNNRLSSEKIYNAKHLERQIDEVGREVFGDCVSSLPAFCWHYAFRIWSFSAGMSPNRSRATNPSPNASRNGAH